METKICVFDKNAISFNIEKDNKMMVNATEMAKIFDKQVNEFMSNSSTKMFIEECLKNGNSRFLGIEKEEDLYQSRQKSGTWMHRVLALKFAAWLNPAFELWVYSTVEKLLFGKFVEREASLKKTISLQRESEMLAAKPQKTGEDFERYLEIARKLRLEQAVRKNLTTETVHEMKDLFEDQSQDE